MAVLITFVTDAVPLINLPKPDIHLIPLPATAPNCPSPAKAAPPIAPLIAPESAPSSKPSRNEPPLAIISKITFLKIQTQIYNKFWTYKLIRTRTLRIQVNCLFNKFKRLHHILGARNTNDKSKITILIT